MTNDDKDLLPCPFCGGEAELESVYVSCKNCKSKGILILMTISQWNTRATPQQPSEPLKELDRDELLGSIAQAWCNENNKNKEMDATLAMDICDIIFKKFGQPSEKKALSVEANE